MTLTIDHLVRFLSGYRRREMSDPRLKKSAVLILFYPKGGELTVLLTKRTEDVEHHKGQISFPGGSMDDDDDTLIVTALRESEEEIGLPRSIVRVLGVFDDYETPSGFVITPVIGCVEILPPLAPHVAEVAEILEVPVSMFLNPDNERIEQRIRHSVVLDVYFYRHGGHEIWGATAAILRSFLLSLRQSLEGDAAR
jgi:8-oxo-dGTP pyrophosphatase MutT (NUDIX family)